MVGNGGLVNLGELTKPATLLVEKMADAVGGAFKPWQIRRVADAEADAMVTRAAAELRIDELQQRALRRFVAEETTKQANLESIGALALPNVREDARTEEVDHDWLFNYVDKSKLVSDREMQKLWARILAGEANEPGTVSRRTINALVSLDQADAETFRALCRFRTRLGSSYVPLVWDVSDAIYQAHSVGFDDLRHLSGMGLITTELDPSIQYSFTDVPEWTAVDYFGSKARVGRNEDRIWVGSVLFTRTGEELAQFVDAEPVPDFLAFLGKKWAESSHPFEHAADGTPTEDEP